MILLILACIRFEKQIKW
uniref:Uncharacterized protein n=1 Tax=Rhizophora mucronata TaxID=61149 RepID=A0A2P2KX25_RHIMU